MIIKNQNFDEILDSNLDVLERLKKCNNCITCKHLIILNKRDIKAYCKKNDWIFKPSLACQTTICGNYEDNTRND